jgi:hypothetical protein
MLYFTGQVYKFSEQDVLEQQQAGTVLEVPFQGRKIGVPIFLEQTINSERYILRPFYRSLLKKKRHMAILCKMVLQHTLLIIRLF